MVDLVYCLTNLSFLIFYYYYYTNYALIISCSSSRDVCLSICLSLSCLIVTISELLAVSFLRLLSFGKHFYYNEITSSFCCILNYFFDETLIVSVVDWLGWSRSILLCLSFKFSLIFLQIFLPMFLAKDKNP